MTWAEMVMETATASIEALRIVLIGSLVGYQLLSDRPVQSLWNFLGPKRYWWLAGVGYRVTDDSGAWIENLN